MVGFILGSMLEDNFARSMQLYDGVAFILPRPMTLALLILAIILIVLPSFNKYWKRRREKSETQIS